MRIQQEIQTENIATEAIKSGPQSPSTDRKIII